MFSDAYIFATCSECKTEFELELPFTYGRTMHVDGYYNLKALKRQMRTDGWEITQPEGDDLGVCPECADELKESNQEMTEETER